MGFFEDLGDWWGNGGGASTANAVVNIAGNEYMADQYREANHDTLNFQRDIYNQNVDRLDPYNQLGLRNIDPLQDAARNNPQARNMFAGQYSIDPNVATNPVAVNQMDVLAADNPFFQASVAEGRRNIENSAAARGKLNSGETLDSLNRSAQAQYLNFIPQMQNVSTARDSMNLAADSQHFGQQMGNVGNQFALNDQLFQQYYGANNFDQSADINAYNQLMGLTGGVGQPSAALQARSGNVFMDIGSGTMNNNADNQGLNAMRNVGAASNWWSQLPWNASRPSTPV